MGCGGGLRESYPWVKMDNMGMMRSRFSVRRLRDLHHLLVSTLLSGIVDTTTSS